MKLRHILVGLALLALAALAVLNRAEIIEAVKILRSAHLLVLLLIPVVQIASFTAKAGYYYSFFKTLNYHVPYWRLLKLTFATSFINQISPAAGVTGATFFSYNLRGQVPAGKTTLVEYSRYVLTHLSFVVLLVLALGSVYFGASLDRIVVRVVVLLVSVGLVADIGFLVLLKAKKQLNAIVYFGQSLIDKLSRPFRKVKNQPLLGKHKADELLSEIHHGFEAVLAEWRKLTLPFLFTLLSNLMEVATLYIIFTAIADPINPGKVIISYAVASVVGAISLVPGDVGIYEVAMVATFSGIGVPLALALSATLLYRIINKALLLPIGFFFYSRLLQGLPAHTRQKVRPN